MLTSGDPEFTRPTYSRIVFGNVPAASIFVGASMRVDMATPT
jgi:hypothetical protein